MQLSHVILFKRIRGVLVHDNALYKSTFYLLTYLLTWSTCLCLSYHHLIVFSETDAVHIGLLFLL